MPPPANCAAGFALASTSPSQGYPAGPAPPLRLLFHVSVPLVFPPCRQFPPFKSRYIPNGKSLAMSKTTSPRKKVWNPFVLRLNLMSVGGLHNRAVGRTARSPSGERKRRIFYPPTPGVGQETFAMSVPTPFSPASISQLFHRPDVIVYGIIGWIVAVCGGFDKALNSAEKLVARWHKLRRRWLKEKLRTNEMLASSQRSPVRARKQALKEELQTPLFAPAPQILSARPHHPHLLIWSATLPISETDSPSK